MIKIIGGLESVSLSGMNNPLTARIDSGAKFSSISVQNLFLSEKRLYFSVQDGELSKLYYADNFSEKSFKNVMGWQKRFVAPIEITIGGIVSTSLFSLADRSKMKYPVLLGRSFLNGKFIVDPSRTFMHSK